MLKNIKYSYLVKTEKKKCLKKEKAKPVHLEKQLAVIQPRYVVLLGKTACHAMFGTAIEILKEHGTLRREGGRTYLITLHPAAVLRFPKYASLFAKDFSLLMDLLHSS